jgi:hypothetical protein
MQPQTRLSNNGLEAGHVPRQIDGGHRDKYLKQFD